MARVIKAPNPFMDAPRPWVFLAGSIEGGLAPDWRSAVVEEFRFDNLTLLDPWREDWDDSWKQEMGDANFRGQVEWELDGLEAADAILMHFAPGTTAPISLLEFGLHARSGKLFVSCPEGFWRRGNVEVVCARYEIPLSEAPASTASAVRSMLGYGAVIS